MQDVVSVRHLGGMRLRIRFDDGVQGDVDLARRIRKYPGFMAKLLDPEYFAKVRVNPACGTVSWPGGEIDLDTLVLYSYVTGRSIRSLLNRKPWPKAASLASVRPKRRRTISGGAAQSRKPARSNKRRRKPSAEVVRGPER